MQHNTDDLFFIVERIRSMGWPQSEQDLLTAVNVCIQCR